MFSQYAYALLCGVNLGILVFKIRMYACERRNTFSLLPQAGEGPGMRELARAMDVKSSVNFYK
jgi:hypothetical protein